MLTTAEFCRREYGQKLYKISFDAGFTCPNRDGTLGTDGCVFCSGAGSGDHAVVLNAEMFLPCKNHFRSVPSGSLKDRKAAGTDAENPSAAQRITDWTQDWNARIEEAKKKVRGKYKGERYIAYFQAFTNTYAPVEDLRRLYLPIVEREDVAVLSIATRPDCLSAEVIALLGELNRRKPVWVELGLQTVKEETASFIRRGYETKVYDEAVRQLNEIGIHTITHVILYLPGETEEDMLATVQHAVAAGSKGIKLQLLQILKGTALERLYDQTFSKIEETVLAEKTEDGGEGANAETEDAIVSSRLQWKIPTMEEYADTVKKCVELCPASMVVHRVTGDPPRRLLIAPKWAADKKRVLNTVRERLEPPQPYYVYMLRCGDGSLYTGSTNHVEKRFRNHAAGRGCKYTASHLPVTLVYTETCRGKSAALKREYEIKQLTKRQKEELVRAWNGNDVSEAAEAKD